MRVISGTAKGRPLKAVPGMGTRPTTDKVKEAIFSMIGPYFDGGAVLDLFAGTGGLGIEALSRGMELAVFTDMDKKSVDVVRANLQAAGFSDKAELYRNDALRAVKALAKRDIRFDLVFLDPPYRLKLLRGLTESLQEGGLLADGATIVMEHDIADKYEEPIGSCIPVRRAEYGETAVTIYKHKRDSDGEDTDAKE